MRRLLLAGILAFAAGGQALASDLPPPSPPRTPVAYVPPVTPVYNWGGFYLGLNMGYGFGTTNWIDSDDPGGETGKFNTNGFVVGPTVGFNFQTDAFVLGAELDFDGSWIDGKKTSSFCSFTGAQCETKSFWLSTARARLGYAVDRVLFYGTGGGAIGDVSTGLSGFFQHHTKTGWTAGAGIEAAFTENVTARIEYLYVKLQDSLCTSPNACGLDPRGSPDDTVKFSASLIRVGVTYKFR
jgi:outer membrane immunogenic protein